ncbi:1,4-dihydroxy-2-naphthoate octaprenyltransferase [Exiguobacterium indicum]|uniref:1,4-dihydroxy-2-naphthoate octaprenyltransferase n=1 Tax=Exiguobacterium acetylicum TaxID=41170 RepID=A0ABX8GBC9_EXIAC|nr:MULTISPECIES: 1,4-dihydroxy-2-naphthoate polyprenyltransferase [Exiguobacterium]AOS99792.1 1,4-dihydroxy-2-naphthoate octaprenyltransferase [Exiguobacterium sp. U13-1]KNH36741.1 1,4-dihydroxy-2-naphthoate octaprenyltransferase [Exiguobacterium acetylicum]KTR59242.1 1,4-dihydroxy-2-naphthoate octaprenyltransferase [Exiguobacterium indicum]MBF8154202.1 1,4-dihydroxy-2-naphthoate polyprenyltransferase [Exiguobacterium sp. TBG-PICH-001]QWB30746.1 1,4-dihydroxy-2-naphthoate polyprenyltransferase
MNKSIAVYWRMTRPHTLTASFVPVVVGTAVVAPRVESIRLDLFVAMLIASMLIQIATNLFNEYYDYKRGLDTEESVGIGGSIVRDGFKPGTILAFALTLYGISALLGVYLCIETSWWLLVVGLISMFVGYIYTGGPLPIAYTPFGEVVAGFFMGYIIIAISAYLQIGYVPTEAVAISVPVAILIGSILLANNIRDLDNDKVNGRKTIACLVGHRRAVYVLIGFFAAAVLSLIIAVLAFEVSWFALLALLSIPLMIKAVRLFWEDLPPEKLMPGMAQTGKVNTIFGLLLAISLVIANI